MMNIANNPDTIRWIAGWQESSTGVFYAEPMGGLTTEQVIESFAEFIQKDIHDGGTAFWLVKDKQASELEELRSRLGKQLEGDS